jgi:RNA polymerase sigma-70 factor, ECF subfamily
VTVQASLDYEVLDDLQLARLIAARDAVAVRLVTTRNNQRLFRTAWSILKDRSEAEEAVQSAYLAAFSRLGAFEGRSSLSTWLTRIAVNEALGRLRKLRRRSAQLEEQGVAVLDTYRELLMRGSDSPAPDAVLAREQLRIILEKAIAGLSDNFRTVFVLREVEGMSVEETAEAIGIPPATVKTRLLRARRRLQQALAPEVESVLAGAFPFAGADCEAMTARVLKAMNLS